MTSSDENSGLEAALAVLAERLAGLTARVETVEAAVRGQAQSLAEAAGLARKVSELSEAVIGTAGGKGSGDFGGHPRIWAAMPDAARVDALRDLARWVAAVLLARYPQTVEVLPPCWPAHPAVVEELDALYWTWTGWATAGSEARARDAADWHDRWLPGVLARITPELKQCVQASEHVKTARQRPGPDRLNQPGWAPEQVFIEEMGAARRTSS